MIHAEKHFLDLWPCKDTLHSFFLLGIFNAAGLHIFSFPVYNFTSYSTTYIFIRQKVLLGILILQCHNALTFLHYSYTKLYSESFRIRVIHTLNCFSCILLWYSVSLQHFMFWCSSKWKGLW